MFARFWIAVAACCTFSQAALAADGAVSPAQVRHAIEEAVPYLEDNGEGWMVERNCNSCHYMAFMVRALRDARQAGIAIDEPEFARRTAWSYSVAKGDGIEGMSAMILARPHSKADAKLQATLKALGDAIVAGQQPEGSWKIGGQVPGQKRPAGESAEVTTRWAVLALDSLEERADEKLTKSREKALTWLKAAKPGKSNEWYVTRLLIEQKVGSPAEAKRHTAELLAAQQSDGGWAWLRGDKSDALATGQSLYVLARAGMTMNDPAMQRACKFLVDTQQDNGEWLVHGTKTATKDKPQHTSSYWGTAWATIGLSNLLPTGTKPAAKPQPKASIVTSAK